MVKFPAKYIELLKSNINEYKGISFIDASRKKNESIENSRKSQKMTKKSELSKSEDKITKKKKRKRKKKPSCDFAEVEPENNAVQLDLGDETSPDSSVIKEKTPSESLAQRRRRKKVTVSSSCKQKLFNHNFQREVKHFSKEEDEKILRAIETANANGKPLMISELCKEINRPYHSTRDRVWKLKNKKGPRQRFTLSEDLIIIDEVLKYIGQETLREIPLPNPGKLSQQLKRKETSCKSHWQYYLKPMLLQYYAGTLNLDVRFMLVDYLAKVYLTLEEVRWEELVRARPEFSGHTDSSLRYQFIELHKILRKGKLMDDSESSLEDIARASKRYFQQRRQRGIAEAKLQRQREITTYFDNFIKKHKLQPGT